MVNRLEPKNYLIRPFDLPIMLACPGSISLINEHIKDSRVDAEKASLAHTVAIHMLQSAAGKTFGAFPCGTEEMANAGHAFVEYVLGRVRKNHDYDPGVKVMVDENLELHSMIPAHFGTVDCLILSVGQVEVIEYRFDAKEKISVYDEEYPAAPELMGYALAAIRKYDANYHFQIVRLSYFQPRLSNVSTILLTAEEVVDWGKHILSPACHIALGDDPDFNPGDHCCRCPVRSVCKAYIRKQLNLIRIMDTDPAELSPVGMGLVLDYAAEVEQWIEDVRAAALQMAVSGTEVPGYKVVEARTKRRWTDEDTAAKVVSLAGYDPYEQHLRGITAMEKLLGRDQFHALLSEYVEKPKGAPVLVPLEDTRPAIETENKNP